MSVKSVGRVLCRLARVGLVMIRGIGPLAALSGHRWVDTYLDPQRRARGDIRQLIVQAMDAL